VSERIKNNRTIVLFCAGKRRIQPLMEMRDQHDKLDQDKLDKSITVILGDKYIYIYTLPSLHHVLLHRPVIVINSRSIAM